MELNSKQRKRYIYIYIYIGQITDSEYEYPRSVSTNHKMAINRRNELRRFCKGGFNIFDKRKSGSADYKTIDLSEINNECINIEQSVHLKHNIQTGQGTPKKFAYVQSKSPGKKGKLPIRQLKTIDPYADLYRSHSKGEITL